MAVPENSPFPWPDISGRMHGAHHILPIRVYFEDTDFSGVVYHASYLRWCERGRSDFMRLMGISHASLADPGISCEPSAFAVRRITADFLKPARIDDMLEVYTEIAVLTKASITLRQKIAREGIELFNLEALCVLVSVSGRVLRLPERLNSMPKSY